MWGCAHDHCSAVCWRRRGDLSLEVLGRIGFGSRGRNKPQCCCEFDEFFQLRVRAVIDRHCKGEPISGPECHHVPPTQLYWWDEEYYGYIFLHAKCGL